MEKIQTCRVTAEWIQGRGKQEFVEFVPGGGWTAESCDSAAYFYRISHLRTWFIACSRFQKALSLALNDLGVGTR